MNGDYLKNKVHKAIYEADSYEESQARKQVLAKAYLNRHKPFTEEIWVDLYKDWILSGGEKFGLKQLRTYAAYNYRPLERRKNIKGGYANK